jgi:hypothetical protein
MKVYMLTITAFEINLLALVTPKMPSLFAHTHLCCNFVSALQQLGSDPRTQRLGSTSVWLLAAAINQGMGPREYLVGVQFLLIPVKALHKMYRAKRAQEYKKAPRYSRRAASRNTGGWAEAQLTLLLSPHSVPCPNLSKALQMIIHY